MRKMGFAVIGLSVLLLGFSIGLADDPSGLIVVRASDNSLWKATCVGTTCSAFTSISGLFSSQPTLYWDENIQRYVLWGRASDSSIWRSTFNRFGTFNNDWVSIPGFTPSPVAGAGGGVTNNFSASGVNSSAVTLATTATDISSYNNWSPWDGFQLCTGSGWIILARASGDSGSYVFSRIYLTQTSGGTSTTFQGVQTPPGTPVGDTAFPFSFQRWFFTSGGSLDNCYMTADKSSAGTAAIYHAMVSIQYFPYSY